MTLSPNELRVGEGAQSKERRDLDQQLTSSSPEQTLRGLKGARQGLCFQELWHLSCDLPLLISIPPLTSSVSSMVISSDPSNEESVLQLERRGGADRPHHHGLSEK